MTDTKTVCFAVFYGKSWVSWGIKAATRSKKYSHVGYTYLENDVYELIECWQHSDNWFGHWEYSSWKNHSPGTEYRILGLDLPDDEADKVDEYFRGLADDEVKYDWLGLIGFLGFVLLKKIKGSIKRRFCSDGCTEGLRQADSLKPRLVETNSKHVSPQRFVEQYYNLGCREIARGVT